MMSPVLTELQVVIWGLYFYFSHRSLLHRSLAHCHTRLTPASLTNMNAGLPVQAYNNYVTSPINVLCHSLNVVMLLSLCCFVMSLSHVMKLKVRHNSSHVTQLCLVSLFVTCHFQLFHVILLLIILVDAWCCVFQFKVMICLIICSCCHVIISIT